MAYFLVDHIAVATNAYVMRAAGHRVLDLRNLEVDTYGIGFAGFLRLDVFDFGFHSLFADGGVGMVFTTDAFPPEGTKWNFVQRYGGGLSVHLHEDASLVIGWRHMHVSNGKGFGHPRNPSYDGDGLFAGLRFGWRTSSE
jgi:hypothetical protein